MSYELGFWKYEKGVYLDPEEVYEQLCQGIPVAGVETLPIEKILKKITIEFITFEQIDAYTFKSESEGSFHVTVTDRFVRLDCYNMKTEDMNVFIDIMLEFDCPLYDPQLPERFDSEFAAFDSDDY